MNIYLIERTDNPGYDEYDSWVVSARSHKQARIVGPYGERYGTDDYDITFLGVAGRAYQRMKPQLILGSFNAG